MNDQRGVWQKQRYGSPPSIPACTCKKQSDTLYVAIRGGVRPQLGPGVVAQRGPKMPQTLPMWRIACHIGYLGPQRAFYSVLVIF